MVIVSRMMLTMVWMKVMVMMMKENVNMIKIDVSIPTSTRWR